MTPDAVHSGRKGSLQIADNPWEVGKRLGPLVLMSPTLKLSFNPPPGRSNCLGEEVTGGG